MELSKVTITIYDIPEEYLSEYWQMVNKVAAKRGEVVTRCDEFNFNWHMMNPNAWANIMANATAQHCEERAVPGN